MLQDDLNKLCEWSLKWGMKFNVNKSKIMSIHSAKNVIQFGYKMNGCLFERVSEYMDLGIIVTENLSWQKQIDSSCKKANRRIGFVKRKINYGCSKEIKLLCYTSLIRPLIEYGSIIWNTSNRTQVLQLESIQRRFTKFILGNNGLSYRDRLKECNILPLTMRREYLDYSFLFICINDKIDINIFNYVEVFDSVIDTRLNADEALRLKHVYPRKV